jgi:hypothetical protein
MFGMKPGMARRCWPASTNFPPTGPRLRWLFCICCFCLAHALETMSKDKSGAAESLMSSSPALTTSTGTRRSPSMPLVAPLAIRVALLAGLWRTQKNPDLYDRIESACSGRESIRFDAAKIKLLADAHPAFSHLQQIRDSSPFWSRYFLQRKRKSAPVSRFRAT